MNVTLDELKRQVRVDFDDDDTLLREILEGAEAGVIRQTERTEEELIEMGGGKFPADLKRAILIRAADFYNHPEGSDKADVYVDTIIRPFKKL